MTASDGRRAPAAVSFIDRPETMGDREIVRGLLVGDARAAAALWERYEPLVRRLLGRTLGVQCDVADLVQDVFLGVVRGLRGLRSEEGLRAYVVGATMNTARLALRRKRRGDRIFFGSGGDEEHLQACGLEPASLCDTARAVAALYSLLDAVGEEARTVFVLRHVEQLGLVEIADALRMSVPTAKRRVKRAESLVYARARGVPELAPYLAAVRKEGDS